MQSIPRETIPLLKTQKKQPNKTMKPRFAGPIAGLATLRIPAAFAGTSAVEPFDTQPADPWLKASLNVGHETLHVYRGADSSFGGALGAMDSRNEGRAGLTPSSRFQARV